MKLPTIGILLILLTSSGTLEYVGIVSFTMSVEIRSNGSISPENSFVRVTILPNSSTISGAKSSGSNPAFLNAAPYRAFSPE